MLIPDIKKINKDLTNQTEKLYIDTINNKASYYNIDILFSEKDKTKFIKKIESTIRNSIEYKNYIGILKNELNFKKCTFIPGIDISEIKVSIEFHHYPFTLYDLVSIEVEKEIKTGNKHINTFVIADRVMKLHYKNLVGLVVLCKTVHELVHDGKKFINKKYIIGNYTKYIEKYNLTHDINEDLLTKIEDLNKLSKDEDNGANIDGSILDIKILEVIIEDIDLKKKIEKIVENIA